MFRAAAAVPHGLRGYGRARGSTSGSWPPLRIQAHCFLFLFFSFSFPSPLFGPSLVHRLPLSLPLAFIPSSHRTPHCRNGRRRSSRSSPGRGCRRWARGRQHRGGDGRRLPRAVAPAPSLGCLPCEHVARIAGTRCGRGAADRAATRERGERGDVTALALARVFSQWRRRCVRRWHRLAPVTLAAAAVGKERGGGQTEETETASSVLLTLGRFSLPPPLLSICTARRCRLPSLPSPGRQ